MMLTISDEIGHIVSVYSFSVFSAFSQFKNISLYLNYYVVYMHVLKRNIATFYQMSFEIY